MDVSSLFLYITYSFISYINILSQHRHKLHLKQYAMFLEKHRIWSENPALSF